MHTVYQYPLLSMLTTLVMYRQLNSIHRPLASPIYNGLKPSTYTKSCVTEFLFQLLNIMWETQEQKEALLHLPVVLPPPY